MSGLSAHPRLVRIVDREIGFSPGNSGLHLLGDMLGTPCMALTQAADTLSIVTDGIVAFVPCERAAKLYLKMPHLSGFFSFVALT